MSQNPTPISPRLQALWRDLNNGHATALDSFWDEIEAQGTPLFEPIPDNPGQVYVTFLWRGDDATENVIVSKEFFFTEFAQLERLPGTDVWFHTEPVRRDLRLLYRMNANDPLTLPSMRGDFQTYLDRQAMLQTDPLNPVVFEVPPDEEKIGRITGVQFSVLAAPGAAPETHVAARPDTPKGQVTLHRFASKILGNERRIYVYTPPNYSDDSDPYPLLVTSDGWAYVHVLSASTVLDNLQAEGAIPPLVAIFIDNARGQRSVELGAYTPFNEFLKHELLPWAHTHYQVTENPSQSVIAGYSLGGLASVYAGLQLSNTFGCVLSQSGAFGRQKNNDPEPAWIIRQFVSTETLPLRFYLDVGLLEDQPQQPDHPSFLTMNRHMRDVLRAKGYSVAYAEFGGGHDFVSWSQTLANGLIALLGE